MGCDIHPYYEVLSRKNGLWQFHDWEKKHETGKITIYDEGTPCEYKEVQHDYSKLLDDPLHIGRNYNLFAILANVRNGRGFAGCHTSAGFNAIDEPRGLPYDVTPQVAKISQDYGVDGHSHSWLLLEEMLEYDWDQTTSIYGVVSLREYKRFKQEGMPEYYSGGISGGKTKTVSNAEMDKLLEKNLGIEPLPKDLGLIGAIFEDMGDIERIQYYTQVAWQESYRSAVGPGWFETLKEMQGLGLPDEVRLVFFFDN